jgi:hypothetical protein
MRFEAGAGYSQTLANQGGEFGFAVSSMIGGPISLLLSGSAVYY